MPGSWPRRPAGLRIFDDADGKVNLARPTFCAPCSWSASSPCWAIAAKAAAPPSSLPPDAELAERLYQVFVDAVARQGIGGHRPLRQHMQVELVNDGPVTPRARKQVIPDYSSRATAVSAVPKLEQTSSIVRHG